MEKNIIGQTLYKIRKGKNLTVKYLTQGLISPQHYYRVEKGDAYLSGIFLLEILNRMNVSYKEFSILINSKTEKKKEHFNRRIFPEEPSGNDFFYSHYKSENKDDSLKLEIIKKYLFEKEEFFHYEFTLFNNYLRFFNVELVEKLSKTANKYILKLENIPEYRLERIKFLNNVSYYYLENNKIKEAMSNFNTLNLLVNNNLNDIPMLQLYQYKFLEHIFNGLPLNHLYYEADNLGMDNLVVDIKNILKKVDYKSLEFYLLNKVVR